MTDLLDIAKARFKEAQEAEETQRKREIDDLRFQMPEYQWDDAARRQRLGTGTDGVPQPARPVLSISKIDQPIQLITNQQVSAHLGVQIHPLSPEADEDVAELLQGIYRRIERDSQAQLARSWAFDRAVKCGRGAYRINTEYDDEGGHAFDQRIAIAGILNQDSVYFDPAAQKPDLSDARYAFVTSWVPVSEFKRLYPDAEIGSTEALSFGDVIQEAPEWVRGDGDKQAVLVAEYWYKEVKEETLYLLNSGEVVSELPKGVKAVADRKREVTEIKCCKMTGFEILEEQGWNGKWIPIVPVFGKEIQPFDSKRQWIGVIHPAKDAQRMYNYAASSAIELAALEPKAPWIMAEGQDEGHEVEWQQANIRNLPALHYKPTTIGGQPAPPPARTQIDVGRLGPSLSLLQQADQFIQVATATYDPSLGRGNSKERSGRAISALQQQGDSASSNYLQGLANISMAYEAKVVLDLIPKIYDRPGRIVRTLDPEDDTEMVMLGRPFVTDPETKRPIAVRVAMDNGKPRLPLRIVPPYPPQFAQKMAPPPQPMMPVGMQPGMPPQVGPGQLPPAGPGGPEDAPPQVGAAPQMAMAGPGMPPTDVMPQAGPPMAPPPGAGMQPGMEPAPGLPMAPEMPKPQYYDLSEGVYSVSVDIGRSRQTLQAEGAEEIGQILQAQPQLMSLIGPIYFRFRDFPGSREIAELLAKVRDKQFPGLVDKGEGMDLQQAQAQAQALQQQVDAMQQVIEQGKKVLETQQIQEQGKLQKAAMDNASREKVATIEAQTKVLLAQLEGRLKTLEASLQRRHEVDAQAFDAAHDAASSAQGQASAVMSQALSKALAPPASAGEVPLTQEGEM
jgi:hypothetical protein